MSSRTTAILVTVAVLAGAAVAGVGLATQGSSKPARVLQIDEQRGLVGNVVLGETATNVIGVLGKPTLKKNLPTPDLGGFTLSVLVYKHLTVRLRNDRVTSIATNDPAARTARAVRIGDPFSAARASYGKAAQCNPSSPDKQAAHPVCSIGVASGVLWIYGDPIREIKLVRTS